LWLFTERGTASLGAAGYHSEIRRRKKVGAALFMGMFVPIVPPGLRGAIEKTGSERENSSFHIQSPGFGTFWLLLDRNQAPDGAIPDSRTDTQM